MKHLLIIFSLLLTSVSWSKDVDYTDLIKRDGLWYERFTNETFTGNSTGREQGKLKKGKWDGEYRYYWESGQLGTKAYYKNGKIEGEQLNYYENGQLWFKVNYKDGEREGEYLGYYESGQLRIKGNSKDGKQDGEWLQYDESGKLTKTQIYKDGKLVEVIKH